MILDQMGDTAAPPAAANLTPAQVLGAGGLMADRLPGYQPRESQIRMAEAVMQTLTDGGELLVEAPCGVGKSFGHLVPAILHAVPNGQRVVVATANIALQEQLVQKDLPFLRDLLPAAFSYSLLKGRGQYACADKLLEHNSTLFAGHYTPEDAAEFQKVLDWANQTATGDSSELTFRPNAKTWRHFSIGDTSECVGCDLPCFHKAAIANAMDADIVVTNYHLLFADLQVRKMTGGMAAVLPPYEILIADEAHEIPEIGAGFAGEEVGRFSFRALKNFLSGPTWQRLDNEVERFSRALTQAKFMEANKTRITSPGCVEYGELTACLERARHELMVNKGREDPDGKAYKQLERRVTQCKEAIRRIAMLVDQEEEDWVYWVDEWYPPQGGAAMGKLCGKPVSIAKHLAHGLYPYLGAFVATSATLTTARGDFTFIRERLGLQKPKQLLLPSPFDFRHSALLVIPECLPEPNDPEFRDRMITSLREAVLEAKGRSLLLFTSNSAMEQAWRGLEQTFMRAGYRCLQQGTAPSTILIAEFKRDISSVLFATRTFFQGIDVPGEALSLVALDRLPFPSPADPTMDWIAEHDPKGWFFNHSLPLALITFRQIFGRLIRRDTDKGVMLLMDGRVQSKKYGAQFLKAVPGGMISNEITSVGSFLSDDDDPFA